MFRLTRPFAMAPVFITVIAIVIAFIVVADKMLALVLTCVWIVALVVHLARVHRQSRTAVVRSYPLGAGAQATFDGSEVSFRTPSASGTVGIGMLRGVRRRSDVLLLRRTDKLVIPLPAAAFPADDLARLEAALPAV